MIIIRDKQFGKGAKSVVNLTPPLTVKSLDGFYTQLKRGVKFFMPNGELFAYLCANDPRSCFFVNAFVLDEKTNYQFSTGTIQESQLGIAGMGYVESIDLANAIWKNVNSDISLSAAP